MASGKNTDVTAVIKATDMDTYHQNMAIASAESALSSLNSTKEIASFIKEEFSRNIPGYWHCVVGRHFGAWVTHEAKYYIYFYIGQMAFLLFKSG